MNPLRHVPSLDFLAMNDVTGYSMNLDGSHSFPTEISPYQGPESSEVDRTEECFQFQNVHHENSTTYDARIQPEFPIMKCLRSTDCENQLSQHNDNSTFNPIADSPQYRAYRARQHDGDSHDDQKWPPDLETYFLDAMMNIPPMGRQKYTFDGKPHGRNELIALYIWIAYKESLPANMTPDPSMNRTRKQISSHIQVLKKFMRGHTAFHQMFPSSNTVPENGYSFDDNPCLIALSQGRLPSEEYRDQIKYNHYNRISQLENEKKNFSYSFLTIKPKYFSLGCCRKIHSCPITSSATSAKLESTYGYPKFSEEDLRYKYLDHDEMQISQMNDENLDSIPHWREKFPPLLATLQTASPCETNPKIIHMQASINFLNSLELKNINDKLQCGLVLSISEVLESQNKSYEWCSISTLTEPRELYDDPDFTTTIIGLKPEVFRRNHSSSTSLPTDEHQILIPFPTRKWAVHLFTSLQSCISNYKGAYYQNTDRSSNHGANDCHQPSMFIKSSQVRILPFSIYQELFSIDKSNPLSPKSCRRVILLWTFYYNSNIEELANLPALCWRFLHPPTPLVPSTLPTITLSNDSDKYLPQQYHQQVSQAKLGLKSHFSDIRPLSVSSPVNTTVPSYSNPVSSFSLRLVESNQPNINIYNSYTNPLRCQYLNSESSYSLPTPDSSINTTSNFPSSVNKSEKQNNYDYFHTSSNISSQQYEQPQSQPQSQLLPFNQARQDIELLVHNNDNSDEAYNLIPWSSMDLYSASYKL